jgi:hypothetical protein
LIGVAISSIIAQEVTPTHMPSIMISTSSPSVHPTVIPTVNPSIHDSGSIRKDSHNTTIIIASTVSAGILVLVIVFSYFRHKNKAKLLAGLSIMPIEAINDSDLNASNKINLKSSSSYRFDFIGRLSNLLRPKSSLQIVPSSSAGLPIQSILNKSNSSRFHISSSIEVLDPIKNDLICR